MVGLQVAAISPTRSVSGLASLASGYRRCPKLHVHSTKAAVNVKWGPKHWLEAFWVPLAWPHVLLSSLPVMVKRRTESPF